MKDDYVVYIYTFSHLTSGGIVKLEFYGNNNELVNWMLDNCYDIVSKKWRYSKQKREYKLYDKKNKLHE